MVMPKIPQTHSTLIIITGPTAVGKTNIAIEVAKHFRTEIISADSRQFYKDLKIGTAVPTDEQLRTVKHHFIGHLNLDDRYNVSKFEKDTLILLNELFVRNPVVILTGGSGLYIKAITDGIDELPDADPEIREKLNIIYQNEGLSAIRRMLFNYDPEYAARVDAANPVRILRALEVYMQTGTAYSEHLNNPKSRRDFNIIKIALNLPRELLHQRINMRVDEMIEDGLIDEARSFYHLKHLNALNTVGYKELFEHFEGHISLEDAIEKIKTNTRRYARRQITWFNKDKEFQWMIPDSNTVITWIKSQIDSDNPDF